MATVGELKAILTLNTAPFVASAKAAESSAAAMGSKFTSAGVGMLAVGGIMAVGLGMAAKAAEEEEAAITNLNTAMSNSPQMAGQTADAFLDQAAALQDVTKFADDATIASQAMLATFGTTQQEVLGLTPLIQDLATVMGMDLMSATRLVGKAMAGNSGALGRVGVDIDEAAFAADRFGAVMEALELKAGGAAEAIGDTFSGRVTILKNNLGDLAEGVGRGAVDAFSDMLAPVEAISAGLERISPEAQEAAGKIAAFGAAGLIAAGSASMLAGGILNMISRFGALKAAIAASSLAGMGPVFAGVAIAVGVGAAAIALFGSAAQKTIGDVDALSAALGEQNTRLGENSREWLANTIMTGGDDLRDFGARMAEVGLTVGDLDRALANGGSEMEAFLAAMDPSADALEEMGNQGRAGAIAVDSALSGTREVLDGLGASFDEVADDQATHNALLGAGAMSAEELADAYGTLNAQIDEYLNKIQGSEEAAAAEAEAQQALQVALLENGRTFDVNTQAGRDNIAARNSWVDAVAGQIQAAADYGAITGKTGEAQGRMNEAVRAAVGDLRAARDAGLITQQQFLTLKNQIDRMPSEVNLPVNSNVDSVLTAFEQLPAAIRAAATAADAAQANAAVATQSLGPGPEATGHSAIGVDKGSAPISEASMERAMSRALAKTVSPVYMAN